MNINNCTLTKGLDFFGLVHIIFERTYMIRNYKYIYKCLTTAIDNCEKINVYILTFSLFAYFQNCLKVLNCITYPRNPQPPRWSASWTVFFHIENKNYYSIVFVSVTQELTRPLLM